MPWQSPKPADAPDSSASTSNLLPIKLALRWLSEEAGLQNLSLCAYVPWVFSLLPDGIGHLCKRCAPE